MSETTKHTPGPWQSRNRVIWPAEGDAVASVPGSTRAQKTVAEANGQLIAAAPDLLHEVQAAAQSMRSLISVIEATGGSHYYLQDVMDDLRMIVVCLDNAARKAQGDSP